MAVKKKTSLRRWFYRCAFVLRITNYLVSIIERCFSSPVTESRGIPTRLPWHRLTTQLFFSWMCPSKKIRSISSRRASKQSELRRHRVAAEFDRFLQAISASAQSLMPATDQDVVDCMCFLITRGDGAKPVVHAPSCAEGGAKA